MSKRDSAVQTFQGLTGTAPMRAAKAVMKALNADSSARRVHRACLSRLAPSEQTITVRGITQRFHTSSLDEYEMFQWYPERKPSFPVLPDIVDRLKPDDVFWDVGANAGIYTCFGATQIDSGYVVAIEPNPNSVSRIEENLTLNGASATIYPYALMESPGELALDIDRDDVAGSYGSITTAEGGGYTVEATTGDWLVEQGTPAPTVLKIDVEGAELDAFSGMKQTISRPECRLIYCNTIGRGDDPGSIAAEERHWLEERGFGVEVLWEWALEGYCGQYIRAVRI